MSKDAQELWSYPTHHVYEGVTYCDAFRAEALDKVKHLELAPSDALLCTYPKSGKPKINYLRQLYVCQEISNYFLTWLV